LLVVAILRQSPKIQELNAEINQKSLAIGQLQAELGAVRADYDQLLATVSGLL